MTTYTHRKTPHQESWTKAEGCNTTTVYLIAKAHEVHFCPSDKPVKLHLQGEESTEAAYEAALAKAKAAGVKGSKLKPKE